MKTIKYLVLGAMLTGLGTPAMAQTLDPRATVSEVTNLIKSGAADADKQIATLAKPFKKDAKTLALIGREYLNQKNTVKAAEYATKALSASKNKCAEAWVILGDIEGNYNDNPGKAVENYQQAMYFDIANPVGYKRYAVAMSASNLQESLSALETLGKNVPGYPWQIEAAQICGKKDSKKAIYYYDMVDRSKMKAEQLVDYASTCWLQGENDKSQEIVNAGIKMYPDYAQLYRVGLYATVGKENYTEAVEYAKNLFAKIDADKIIVNDYLSAGAAYAGMKNVADAKKMYEKAMEMSKENKNNLATAQKGLSDLYAEENNYDEAIKYYTLYLDNKENATATDYAGLGSLYTYQASALEGEAQIAAVANADKVYAELVSKFEDAAEFGTFQRARIAGIIDPEQTNGTAKPHWDKLIEIIVADGRIEGTSKARLTQAYLYNMIYAFKIQDNTVAAKEYAAKLLELDPENAPAKMISELK